MKQFQYVITDPVGIHARPAGLLVKAAKALDSTVTVEKVGGSDQPGKLRCQGRRYRHCHRGGRQRGGQPAGHGAVLPGESVT